MNQDEKQGSPVGRFGLRTNLLMLCSATLAIGVGATAYWLGRLHAPQQVWRQLPVLALALSSTLVLVLVNVGLRWFRWHFLTRRVGVHLTTRDSLLVYMATLGAIMTPFYLGELCRALLLRRKYPRMGLPVAVIWLFERSSDALMLGLFVSLIRGQHLLLLIGAGLWLAVLLGCRASGIRTRLDGFPPVTMLTVAMLTTGVAWVVPGAALWVVLQLLHSPLPFGSTLGVFSYATLAGSLTGAPLGVGVAGPLMIGQLAELGLRLNTIILATAVFRWGTAWFALASGVLVALIFRRHLVAILHPERGVDHFEDIAGGYEQEIPAHMRDRLLVRKIEIMQRSFAGAGDALEGHRGLDIGCGQGWYACEMARLGCEMYGLDQAAEQISRARWNARRRGVQVHFQATSAATLPFPDDYFSFAYAINVLHHIVAEDTRRQALREIIRVLKPGGTFFLHEINTTNPLFHFYISYVFPLIRAIDEGTERWIRPDDLPAVPGGRWEGEIDYFTFLPDFVPAALLERATPLEQTLERSRWQRWSAHYVARLVKQEVPATLTLEEEPETGRIAA